MSSEKWSEQPTKATPITSDILVILDTEDFDINKQITIGTIPNLEANTSSNQGTGEGLALAKSGVNLPFKSLLGETDKIVLTGNTNDVTFSLGSDVVTIDKANTFEDFAQTFQDNKLFIRNPADSFSYQIIAGAITANAILNLPLVSATETLVGRVSSDTLTNKSIDAVNNTLSNIDETMMIVDTGTSGLVLTSNGVGIAPTYQSGGGGSGTLSGLSDVDLTGQLTGAILVNVDGTDWEDLNPGSNTQVLTISGGIPVWAASPTQTPWLQTIEAQNENLENLGVLNFSLTGTTAFGATEPYINYNTSLAPDAMIINNPSSTELQIQFAQTEEYTYDANKFDLHNNTIKNILQIEDVNENEQLIFGSIGSAVNEFTLTNAATGNAPVLEVTGGNDDIDMILRAKADGTVFGTRETFAYPLDNETTAPFTGIKFTTAPAPYNMKIEDAISGLTTAGTGVTLFEIDVQKETAVNSDSFSSIFSTLPTIDASEFTSTTAAAPPVISTTTWEKGRRLQLSISALDTDGLARGPKIELLVHATAK